MESLSNRMHIYGFKPVQQYKTIKFSKFQRLKRAIVNKKISLLFVKQIEIPVFNVSTTNSVS